MPRQDCNLGLGRWGQASHNLRTSRADLPGAASFFDCFCPPHALLVISFALAGLGVACATAAAVLPYVADLMSLVGAVLTMTVSLVLPALMHVRLLGAELSPAGVACAGAVLLLGLLCAAVGAQSAIGSLRAKMAAAAAAAVV